MWLNEFKIALIEKDVEKLEKLADADLQFDTLEEMQEAAFLIKQAEDFFGELKKETAFAMQQLQKNRDFLNATQSQQFNQLDVRS